MITCRRCKQLAERSTQKGRICAPCYKAYMKEWQASNKERVQKQRGEKYRTVYRNDPNWVEANNKRSRDRHQLVRHEAIMAYGGYVCKCCGETEPKFMTLDHVLNNGAAHRRTMGNQNSARAPVFKWLRDHGYPPGFQVLCWNCNSGRHFNGGICPHKTTQETPREFRENPVWAILSEAA